MELKFKALAGRGVGGWGDGGDRGVLQQEGRAGGLWGARQWGTEPQFHNGLVLRVNEILLFLPLILLYQAPINI